MNYLKESLSATVRKGTTLELRCLLRPRAIHSVVWITCALHASKKGLTQVLSKGPRLRVGVPPDPVSGWKGALRHFFLVPTRPQKRPEGSASEDLGLSFFRQVLKEVGGSLGTATL